MILSEFFHSFIDTVTITGLCIIRDENLSWCYIRSKFQLSDMSRTGIDNIRPLHCSVFRRKQDGNCETAFLQKEIRYSSLNNNSHAFMTEPCEICDNWQSVKLGERIDEKKTWAFVLKCQNK